MLARTTTEEIMKAYVITVEMVCLHSYPMIRFLACAF